MIFLFFKQKEQKDETFLDKLQALIGIKHHTGITEKDPGLEIEMAVNPLYGFLQFFRRDTRWRITKLDIGPCLTILRPMPNHILRSLEPGMGAKKLMLKVIRVSSE